MIRGIQTTVTPQVQVCPSSAPQEPEPRFPSRVHSLPPSSVRALHTTTQRIRSVVKIVVCMPQAHLGGGALGLDVAGLLALVADLLAGGGTLGAVTGEVTVLAAVVALGAVDAVTCCSNVSYLCNGCKSYLGILDEELTGHVANATAGVAGLLGTATEAATTTVGATVATTESTTALGAVAGNVANLTALGTR